MKASNKLSTISSLSNADNYKSSLSYSSSNDIVTSFFKCINENDVIQTRKIFRNLEYMPWEFLEIGGFTGKFVI